jgi:hypothetical protein
MGFVAGLFKAGGRLFEWMVYLFAPDLWRTLFLWRGRVVSMEGYPYTVLTSNGSRVELSSGTRLGDWYGKESVSPLPII